MNDHIAEAPPAPSGTTEVGAPAQMCPAPTITDLTVTVVDRDTQEPIDGARVRITGPSSRRAVTGETGEVAFRGIAAGAYEVAAVADGFPPQAEPVIATVVSTGSNEVKVELERLHRAFLQVVHQRTGEPIARVALKMRTAGGIESEHVTNRRGIVRVPVAVGQTEFEVTSDITSATKSKTLHFVSLTEREIDDREVVDEDAERLSPQLRIAQIEKHRVRSGETLDSIAEANDMTPQRLAEFNWGTSEPTEINRHMQDDVGCTKKKEDSLDYMFDDSDEPGIIFIPKEWRRSFLNNGRLYVIRVDPLLRFLVRLENDIGLRIPEATYEATLADGSEYSGQLGIGGVDVIEDPPPGPLKITFTDHDDILAKSLAASARKALEERDIQELFRILKFNKPAVHEAVHAYRRYYNDLSNEGMVQDSYDAVSDEDTRIHLVGLLLLAGLEVREDATLKEFVDQKRPSAVDLIEPEEE